MCCLEGGEAPVDERLVLGVWNLRGCGVGKAACPSAAPEPPVVWSRPGGGPGHQSPCLPHRAECGASMLPDLASPAPAEVTSAPAMAGPTPAVSPVLAMAIPPGPMVAITTTAPPTASPAVSTVATLGSVTQDR